MQAGIFNGRRTERSHCSEKPRSRRASRRDGRDTRARGIRPASSFVFQQAIADIRLCRDRDCRPSQLHNSPTVQENHSDVPAACTCEAKTKLHSSHGVVQKQRRLGILGAIASDPCFSKRHSNEEETNAAYCTHRPCSYLYPRGRELTHFLPAVSVHQP